MLKKLFGIFKGEKSDEPSSSKSNSLQDRDFIDSTIDDLSINIDISVSLNDEEIRYGYDKAMAIHNSEINKIDISVLKSLSDAEEVSLTLEEILFMKYLDGKKASETDFPQYWTLKYELSFQSAMENLFKGNYIEFADSYSKLGALKANELKDILKRFELPVSGKKSILVDRIIENIPSENLALLLKEDYFSMTAKGQQLAEKYKHIFYFKSRSKFDISIRQADEMIKKNPELNHFSVALSIMESRVESLREKENYDLLRNELHHISEVYGDIGDQAREFTYLLMVTSMDLFEGAYTYDSWLKRYDYSEEKVNRFFEESQFESMDKDYYFLAPGITKKVFKLQESLDFDDHQLKYHFRKVCEKSPVKINMDTFDWKFDILLKERL